MIYCKIENQECKYQFNLKCTIIPEQDTSYFIPSDAKCYKEKKEEKEDIHYHMNSITYTKGYGINRELVDLKDDDLVTIGATRNKDYTYNIIRVPKKEIEDVYREYVHKRIKELKRDSGLFS